MAFLKCVKNSRVIPNGKTVTPTDDVQIWLHCADIWDKSYTSINSVYSDQATLLKLATTDNAIDYMVRSASFVPNFPALYMYLVIIIREYDYCGEKLLNNFSWLRGIRNNGVGFWYQAFNRRVPYMTSATAPSGEVTADSTYTTYYAWYPFRENNTTAWISNHNTAKNATATGWLQYKFHRKVKIYAIGFDEPTNISEVQSYTVKASDDGTNFDDISTDYSSFVPSKEYQYWRLQMTSKNVYSSTTYVPRITVMEFWGRETGGVMSWMKAANIPLSYSYSDISSVCADTSLLASLFNSQDACDYLVTAKSFIEQGICDNENFMTALGNSNYASNLLLSDADWCEAICNSTYSSSVVVSLVPKMTSATTPSGEVFANAYSSTYYPYKAFDGDDSNVGNAWVWSGNGTNIAYIGYDFGKPVKIVKVRWRNRTSSQAIRPIKTLKVQASDDRNTWIDVSGDINGSNAVSAWSSGIFANNIQKSQYRAFVTSVYDTVAVGIQELQFYGREDVT